MADIKFACPNCQQHIQAELGYAGMQIACPTCKASMVVPGTPPAPAPAPAPVLAYAAASAQAAPSPVQAPAPTAASGCPSCNAALPRGAVVCTRCGYNLATRQRIVAGRPAPLGAPTAPSGQAPWYKTPYPYLGAVALLLGLFWYLGRENPTMKLGFIAVAALYYIAVEILVLVAAFKESVGTGFLTLCIPIYGVYFVFKVNEDDTLKILYSGALVIGLIFRFLN